MKTKTVDKILTVGQCEEKDGGWQCRRNAVSGRKKCFQHDRMDRMAGKYGDKL